MKRPTPAQASLLGLNPSELAIIEQHDLLPSQRADRTGTAHFEVADSDGARRLHGQWQRVRIVLATASVLCLLAIIWVLRVYWGQP